MIQKIIKNIVKFLSFILKKIKFFLNEIFKPIWKGIVWSWNKIKPTFASFGQKISNVPFFKRIKIFFSRIGHFLAQLFKKIIKDLVFWEKALVSILFLIILICSSIVGYRFYINKTEVMPVSGGDYTEGMIGEPKYINPTLSQTNKVDSAICSLVFSGLTKYNQKREVVPDLAEKWTISPDGKAYTFYLRKNVLWHDGTSFSADDVVFTSVVISDPDYQGTLGKTWHDITVEKIDNNTVRFTLKEFVAGFLNNTNVGILPKHILTGIPVKDLSLHTFNLNPIGTGPYSFDKLELNSFGGVKSAILKRNNNYYLPKPYLEKIVFNFYTDELSLVEAYKNKEIMGIESIKPDDAKSFGRWRNLNLYRAPLPEYTALFFNTKKPLLNNKNIRQAMSYATDKKEIIRKALFNEAQMADGPILPNFFGYNKNIFKYSFDIAKAKAILEKTGFKVNKDGVMEKDKKNLDFTLVTTNSKANQKIAELIQTQWKKAGINIKIKAIDSNTLQRDYIRPRNYDILLFGESLGADSDVFPYWHSSEVGDPGLNLSSYVNKEVDRCLEDARKTTNIELRQQKYIDFQNMIVDDAPAVFLFRPNYIYGAVSKIKGIDLGYSYIITPADRFNSINQWFINYKRQGK